MNENTSPYIDVNNLPDVKFGDVRFYANDNGKIIKDVFLNCFDILVKEGVCGDRKVVFANCDGLTNSRTIIEGVVKPILSFKGELPKKDVTKFVASRIICNTELRFQKSLDLAIESLLRGCVLVFIDGVEECLMVGVQNIPGRSVDEPNYEVQENGSREGFVEILKTNMTLARKRLVNVNFKIEVLEVGVSTKTKIAVCYMDGKVDKTVLKEVKDRLNSVKMDTILGETYLRKTLDTRRKSMFTMVGKTERPDTMCAKINEGKIAILIDGTPYALIVPRLFIENFQTFDDYLNRPYYAAFMRTIRILSFIISVFLPGSFVAIGLFHQELLPEKMLYNLVVMESNTLFTLTVEALIIHFIYEIVREAGLRVPKSIGHAVSIVGALVIGDAAVTAGLIDAPMLIVVAMTAITSLVETDLYHAIAVLRIAFIIIGGTSGFFGIMVGVAILIINLSSITDYGVYFLSPLAPYNKSLFRDTVTRLSMEKLGKNIFDINKLKGDSK
ncbi:MAG: spore germination protein [Clostridia bacterium]|nr:spore germination protein [Clostridia bacterium]